MMHTPRPYMTVYRPHRPTYNTTDSNLKSAQFDGGQTDQQKCYNMIRNNTSMISTILLLSSIAVSFSIIRHCNLNILKYLLDSMCSLLIFHKTYLYIVADIFICFLGLSHVKHCTCLKCYISHLTVGSVSSTDF